MIKDQCHHKPQVCLFSATIPDWIDEVARYHLTPEYAKIDLAKNLHTKAAKTIKHYIAFCPYFQRIEAIHNLRKLE
jgi:superfamily II DNA/RNA helicase